jgi:hypothetical protein
MKALRNDAAKRWHELKKNSPSQTEEVSDSESESDSESDSGSESD